jgi:hypothetical protein
MPDDMVWYAFARVWSRRFPPCLRFGICLLLELDYLDPLVMQRGLRVTYCGNLRDFRPKGGPNQQAKFPRTDVSRGDR